MKLKTGMYTLAQVYYTYVDLYAQCTLYYTMMYRRVSESEQRKLLLKSITRESYYYLCRRILS